MKKRTLCFSLCAGILILISLGLTVFFGALVWSNQRSVTMELERYLSMIASWGVLVLLVGVWGVHRGMNRLYTRKGVSLSGAWSKLHYVHLLLVVLCAVAFVVFR